jgi:hypothetical protein
MSRHLLGVPARLLQLSGSGTLATPEQKRALKPAIAEINAKTDLEIAIESMDRKKHRR